MMKNKLLIFIFTTLLVTQAGHAQKNYDMSFLEIGIGQRSLGNLPTGVMVNYDTINQPADFGKGKPLLLSLGAVILPEENGFAGCFVAEGMVGQTSSFGVRLGAGYKFGNAHFSFAPMLAIGISRAWNEVAEVNVPEGGMLAYSFNPNAEGVYLSSSQTVKGISGEDVGLRVVNSLFGLRPMCYLSYRVSSKFSLFSNLGFNINIGNGNTSFEATGIGYDDFQQLVDEEVPDRINTPITDSQFLTNQSGVGLDKSPLSYSGFIFQFGIGITGK